MKTKTYWITDENTVITDPASLGYVETNGGPDSLNHPSGRYCDRIAAFRLHVAAVDGSYHRQRKSLEAIRALCVEKGFIYANGTPADGGVDDFGVTRFSGISYRLTVWPRWFPLPLSLRQLAAIT